ncbi:MAG: UDP-N-acetylmuramate dehydrogenase [Clostridia bacterium]|nr:UDP-N-acetylmuramate dehydrogenase [Clostridia bacterium]
MLYSEKVKEILRGIAGREPLSFETDAPLAPYSSFKIGGPASFVVFPETVKALTEVLEALSELPVRTLVFGNASNVLFCDDGIDGVVIFTQKMRGLSLLDDGRIFAEAGVGLTSLSQFAQKCGFCGLEFACGIPGNVGGGVFMNAGAYEHSLSEVISAVDYWDADNKRTVSADISELTFGYRTSCFQDGGRIILGAYFKLEKAADPEKVKALMNDHLRTRNEKQPLEYPSAGSVFKRYPGYYTSKLIDEAGLKGASVGGAQVSEKHAGFIVNRGGATALDVMMLIKLIQDKIYLLHGIHIECEVRYIV